MKGKFNFNNKILTHLFLRFGRSSSESAQIPRYASSFVNLRRLCRREGSMFNSKKN